MGVRVRAHKWSITWTRDEVWASACRLRSGRLTGPASVRLLERQLVDVSKMLVSRRARRLDFGVVATSPVEAEV